MCHALKQHGAAILKNLKTNSLQRRTLEKSYEYLQTIGKQQSYCTKGLLTPKTTFSILKPRNNVFLIYLKFQAI